MVDLDVSMKKAHSSWLWRIIGRGWRLETSLRENHQLFAYNDFQYRSYSFSWREPEQRLTQTGHRHQPSIYSRFACSWPTRNSISAQPGITTTFPPLVTCFRDDWFSQSFFIPEQGFSTFSWIDPSPVREVRTRLQFQQIFISRYCRPIWQNPNAFIIKWVPQESTPAATSSAHSVSERSQKRKFDQPTSTQRSSASIAAPPRHGIILERHLQPYHICVL